MPTPVDRQLQRLSTPRAAAFAGVLFALLFGTVLVLMRTALPADAELGLQWVEGPGKRLRVAVVFLHLLHLLLLVVLVHLLIYQHPYLFALLKIFL